MRVTALILAGGRSSRMGTDKAALVLRDGRTLLHRQFALLRQAGVTDVLVARRADQPRVTIPARTVIDRFPDSGPLAGIAAGLAAISDGVLLVLAVDMPNVSPALLRHLISLSTPHCGVVPRSLHGDEGLIAIYPRSVAPLALQLVASGKGSVRHFTAIASISGRLRRWPITGRFASEFSNWNTPGDLPDSR